jgi:hypothetical protein
MDLPAQRIDTFMQLFDLAASLLALPRNSLQVLDLLFDPGKFLFGFQSDFHLTGVPIPGVPMRLHHGKQKFCSGHNLCTIDGRGRGDFLGFSFPDFRNLHPPLLIDDANATAPA